MEPVRPKTPAEEPHRVRVVATQGEHGLWYISGTRYQFTKGKDGVFRVYAPGCTEDGIEFAHAAD